MIFKSDFLRNVNFFFYKKKHLIIYSIIGFLSLVFELFLRKQINLYISSNELFLHTSLIFGILFAFYFNIKFNFNVPKIYLKKSLIYFCFISICSYLFQYLTFLTTSAKITRKPFQISIFGFHPKFSNNFRSAKD